MQDIHMSAPLRHLIVMYAAQGDGFSIRDGHYCFVYGNAEYGFPVSDYPAIALFDRYVKGQSTGVDVIPWPNMLNGYRI